MAHYSLTDLNDVEAVRAFAYKGKQNGFIGMAEDEVKSAMKSTLEVLGYEVEVKWGQKSGSDIVAICGTRRLLIEAKGVRTISPDAWEFLSVRIGRNHSADDREYHLLWHRFTRSSELYRTCVETSWSSTSSPDVGFLLRQAKRDDIRGGSSALALCIKK